MKVAVVAVGASLEFAGIMLVAAPDLVPLLRRLSAATGRGLRRARGWLERLWWRVARLFGRRRTHTTRVSIGTAGEINVAGRLTVKKVVPGDAPLEVKVDRLLGLVDELQERLSEAEHRLGEQPAAWRRDITEAKWEMEAVAEGKVGALRDAYLMARRVGIGCLAGGVALLSWANFL